MQLPEFKRQKVHTLGQRLQEKQPFIQVVLGPRQVGKTTAVLQAKKRWGTASIYESADSPAPPGTGWIEQAWQAAEFKAANAGPVLVILDEIQKVHGWAECIKALWEQRNPLNQIHLVLCGSSSLQIQSGLTESLAGRFEIIRMPHWSFVEMEQCFQWDLDTYLYYGGYPGAARLRDDWTRWADYVQQSLVETAIGKDILLMHRVQKPALLRRLYALSCDYAGQIISYQKLVGQLQDAGNTTTLAHYQHLLEGAYLVQGLQKWHGTKIRTRSSSPKWQPRNTALVTSQSGLAPADWRAEAKMWGRLVEIAVGAYLVNQGDEEGVEVYYWREKNREVDFVLKKGNRLAAIEVISGHFSKTHSGLGAFQKQWPESKAWIIGKGGLQLSDFMKSRLEMLFY